jgi:hypothetical protein
LAKELPPNANPTATSTMHGRDADIEKRSESLRKWACRTDGPSSTTTLIDRHFASARP